MIILVKIQGKSVRNMSDQVKTKKKKVSSLTSSNINFRPSINTENNNLYHDHVTNKQTNNS